MIKTQFSIIYDQANQSVMLSEWNILIMILIIDSDSICICVILIMIVDDI